MDTKLQYQGTDSAVLQSTDLNAALLAAKAQDLPRQLTRVSKQLKNYGATFIAFEHGAITNRYHDAVKHVNVGESC